MDYRTYDANDELLAKLDWKDVTVLQHSNAADFDLHDDEDEESDDDFCGFPLELKEVDLLDVLPSSSGETETVEAVGEPRT